MGNTLEAGVLGFIGGFAGGKVDQIDTAEKREYAEALRLRKEESEILKQRRLLQINQDFTTNQNITQLEADGLRNPNGTFNTPATMSPELAATANDTNIRDLIKRHQADLIAKGKEERGTTSVSPGTNIFNTGDLRKEVLGGPEASSIKTPFRPLTTSQTNKNINEAIQLAKETTSATTPPFGSSQQKVLQDVSFNDIDTGEKGEGNAYKSMLLSVSTASVTASIKDAVRTNSELGLNLDSTTIAEQIEAEATKIDSALRQASTYYTDAMKQLPDGLTRGERRAKANDFLNNGIPDDESGEIFNLKAMLKQRNYWSDSANNIIRESMLEVSK